MTRARSSLSLIVFAALVGIPSSTSGQSLKGSAAKLDRQNEMVQEHGFAFLETPSQVQSFVDHGLLVPIEPSADFELHDVSFPYARPEAELFIERLAPQYHQACKEKMVVTSLTRPISEQPRNASPRSVHPTGTAVDLRRSASSACRKWLESTLLELDRAGVLDATRETKPAHYHVVVFPREYRGYVEQIQADAGTPSTAPASTAALASTATLASTPLPASTAVKLVLATPTESSVANLRYRVRRGDTLSTIAEKHGTTVARIKAQNGLTGSRIYAGQLLTVPGR